MIQVLVQVFLAQLIDPFRIGMIVALVLTMLRTRAATGTILPLVAGALFVAVLIPLTMGPGATDPFRAAAIGVASNAVILAVVLGVRQAILRGRGSGA